MKNDVQLCFFVLNSITDCLEFTTFFMLNYVFFDVSS